MRFRSPTLRLLCLLGLWAPVALHAASISISKHNLSSRGVGLMSSHDGPEICVFCHTPHSASPQNPLWNRTSSGVTYTPYSSTTLKASVGQPTGSSRLCLSCHDGTIALGQLRNRSTPILMKGGVTTLPPGRGNLGTDLSDDHPISFRYDAALAAADGQLRTPPMSGQVHLDARGELQCTACHDPHSDANGNFLVMNNAGSALCVTCHEIKDWRKSVHSTSLKAWNGALPNPWTHTKETTVAGNGCENCHDPHGAGGKQRLMNFAAEEENCFTCHNGHVADKNLQAEFRKPSVHPVYATTGVHDPLEPVLLPNSGSRHVECSDCHNPHAAADASQGLTVESAFAGVRGIGAAGGIANQVRAEYEICFRCHGDTAVGPARVNRQYPEINTRREFQNLSPTNSFHPVVFPGRNPNVPSLKPGWTTTGMMTCGDCHNSDSGPGAGGTGSAGPHGSIYSPLLERSHLLSDTPSNTSNSGLCFKCHDFVNTTWSSHVQHMGYTSCGTCHDPHGSANQRLINFEPSVVTGARVFQVRGINHGSCTLSCHGKDHDGGAKFTY